MLWWNWVNPESTRFMEIRLAELRVADARAQLVLVHQALVVLAHQGAPEGRPLVARQVAGDALDGGQRVRLLAVVEPALMTAGPSSPFLQGIAP